MSVVPRPSERPLLGVGLMVFAVFSFVLLDSTAKYLSAELPVIQLLWARYTFSLALLLMGLPWIGWRRLAATQRPWAQLLRGMLLVFATASVFTGVRFLPIADFYAISFISPALVAAFAIPILGERVSTSRWLAIGIGFAGVLIVIRPGSGVISAAAIFPLAMATFYALFQILTRVLGGGDSAVTTLFYSMLVGTVVSSVGVPFVWVLPEAELLGALVWMGVVGLAGQLALIQAFRYAQASLLSPFSYTQLVWAALIGYLVFGDVPDRATLVGSIVVIFSGLLLSHPRFNVPPPTSTPVQPLRKRGKI